MIVGFLVLVFKKSNKQIYFHSSKIYKILKNEKVKKIIDLKNIINNSYDFTDTKLCVNVPEICNSITFDNLKNVKYLHIDQELINYDNYNSFLKLKINNAPKLKKLKLVCSNCLDYNFIMLKNLTALEEVTLICASFDPRIFSSPFFKQLKKIKILISDNDDNYIDELYINNFPNLEYLHIYGCEIGRMIFGDNLPKLKYLNIPCDTVFEKHIPSLLKVKIQNSATIICKTFNYFKNVYCLEAQNYDNNVDLNLFPNIYRYKFNDSDFVMSNLKGKPISSVCKKLKLIKLFQSSIGSVSEYTIIINNFKNINNITINSMIHSPNDCDKIYDLSIYDFRNCYRVSIPHKNFCRTMLKNSDTHIVTQH